VAPTAILFAMIATRVLAYEIRPGGTAGDLLGLGSLVLPYLTVFHPDVSADDEAELFGPLAAYADRPGADPQRVRLSVSRGSRAESIDASLLVGQIDETPVYTALLDRPSALRPSPLVFEGPRDEDAEVLTRYVTTSELSMGPADLARKPPRRSTFVARTATVPEPDWPAGAWPPPSASTAPRVLDRPDWWPPFLSWPIPFQDYLRLPRCTFWCHFICSCAR
jgi:hypothetical protein